MENLRVWSSGLAIPAYVIDAPGGGGKIPILPNYVVAHDDEKWILRNYKYDVFVYPDVPEEKPAKEKKPARPIRRKPERPKTPVRVAPQEKVLVPVAEKEKEKLSG